LPGADRHPLAAGPPARPARRGGRRRPAAAVRRGGDDGGGVLGHGQPGPVRGRAAYQQGGPRAGPPGQAAAAAAAAVGLDHRPRCARPPGPDVPRVVGARARGPGMTAREEVLARIGAGLDTPALISLLTERLHDYGTPVRRCRPGDVPAAVSQALAERGARRVAVPGDLGLTGVAGATLIADDDLSPGALDDADGVVTTGALAIAETGTIVLDGGPGQGRRALTLVPDYHLCILRADQIVAIVPQALGRLDPARPQTWISGPSATSDIELDRVQGVHGPRTLEVILVEP